MFRRRPLRKLLFTVRRHRQPLPALPDEVVELIVSFCTRFSLYNSCLASRTLNRLAVPFLYEDPFGLDRPDVTSDTRYNFLAHYQIPRRLAKLCRTIVENPDLAQLVRVFRGVYWRDLSMGSADWEVVLSKLQNITTVSFRAPDTDAFVPPQPPSRIQRVYVDTIAISDWFSRWLTSQGRMQILDLKDASIVYEIPAITLLNLRRLCASHELASFILPHSGRSLAEFKGTAPQTCFAWLLERLREHSPSVRSIAIKVDCSLHFTQTDEEMTQEDLVLSHVYGLPELAHLEVEFNHDAQAAIDVDKLLLVVSRVAEGCPKLKDVGWICEESDGVLPAQVKGYMFALAEGSWVVT